MTAKKKAARKAAAPPPLRAQDVLPQLRQICLSLPETNERLSHGSPTFFIRDKKTFVTFVDDHHGDGILGIWCAAAPGVQGQLVDEEPASWARHILRTRALQAETGGFTEFVPLPFVHMASPIYLQKKSRRGPTFREAMLMHAVPRIAYTGLIDNIQVSWVKMGNAGVTQALQAGVNDLGGTLIDENISRAAGASHGQMMEEDDFRALVEPLGRTLEQRTTLYGRVALA